MTNPRKTSPLPSTPIQTTPIRTGGFNPAPFIPSNQKPTNFGAANQSFGQGIQQNTQVRGSYGNWVPPVVNQTKIPNSATIPPFVPANLNSVNEHGGISGQFNPATSREKLKKLIQSNTHTQQSLQNIVPIVSNLYPQQAPQGQGQAIPVQQQVIPKSSQLPQQQPIFNQPTNNQFARQSQNPGFQQQPIQNSGQVRPTQVPINQHSNQNLPQSQQQFQPFNLNAPLNGTPQVFSGNSRVVNSPLPTQPNSSVTYNLQPQTGSNATNTAIINSGVKPLVPNNLAGSVPNTQVTQTNKKVPNQGGGFFGNLFGGSKTKGVKPTPNSVVKVLPKTNPLAVDKNSAEYLKTLNASDLRKEVIKTEIEIQKALIDTEKSYRQGVTNIRDLISPSAINIETSQISVNTKLVRSFFVLVYPRIIQSGWLEGLVNADMELDISIFVYPRDSSEVLKELRGKVGKIQASLQLNGEQGKARDPQLETAYRDVEGLRDAIQQGVEKFFRVGVYIQVYANTQDQLEKTSQAIEGILSQQNIITKRAALQMDDGFNSCLPILMDNLDVVTNMNTSPLSACFPFVSSDLSSDTGILYGVNRHNSSLIIFDRFELENANSLVFATSGAGKSFAVKLEILRSRMLGVAVIVIDPEQEYKVLADSLGGVFINFSLNSTNRINPFDLPKPLPGESTLDIIRSAIIDLMGLMNLMLGKLTPTEVSIMEKAIQECYNKKDITGTSDLTNVVAPTMSDLVEILQGIVGGDSLAQRLYRYTEGTFAGIFNKPTNVNIDNDFIVFSIRDLQETLRPIAMYILLKYVWTEIRSNLKKRILAVDEAWILMQYEDSARFLYGLAKRARKYYLGITTISQDVTDFLSSPLGKPIVTNAAMKLLLKQSSAAIDQVADTFALTSGEKQVLLQSEVGQGIFFAGPRHVAIEIISFPREYTILTSNPKDILEQQKNQ
jgi:conjugal transfer ATP-binding protein TraC